MYHPIFVSQYKCGLAGCNVYGVISVANLGCGSNVYCGSCGHLACNLKAQTGLNKCLFNAVEKYHQ